jgi:hypothetical protein
MRFFPDQEKRLSPREKWLSPWMVAEEADPSDERNELRNCALSVSDQSDQQLGRVGWARLICGGGNLLRVTPINDIRAVGPTNRQPGSYRCGP